MKASLFFKQLSSFILMILLVVTSIAEITIVAILCYCNVSSDNREVLALTAWLFPGIIFICLYGLNLSLLNCHDSFFIPSFAPAICNIVWIVAVIVIRAYHPTQAMPILAKWVVLGLFCQWLFTFFPTLKYLPLRWKEWMNWKISREIISLAKSFSMGVIGVGAMQINGFVDTLFARYADLRGPTYLWYSIRLQQLALALFGIACVSIIVPRLSRAIKMQNFVQAQEFFSFSYKRIMAIMIPATFALIVLGIPFVDLLYGRGEFSKIAIFKTTFCLWSYSVGLVPITLVILFSSVFYAKNNFYLPTMVSVLTMLVNLFLNVLFVMGLGLGTISTALATSISAWINCLVLYRCVSKEGLNANFNFTSSLKIVSICLIAAFCVIIVEYFSFQEIPFSNAFILPVSFLAKTVHFFLPLAIFIIAVLFSAILGKNNVLLELMQDFLPSWKKDLQR